MQVQSVFPAIDPAATGENIQKLRRERGLTVKDLQAWFHFEEPRAIYKWQKGESLPSIDNLYALSILLDVPMDSIIVGRNFIQQNGPREIPAASHFLGSKAKRSERTRPAMRYMV